MLMSPPEVELAASSPTKNKVCPEYDTKQASDCETPVLKNLGVCITTSLPLFTDPLGPNVVESVRIPSKSQIDPFENYSYPIEPSAIKTSENVNMNVQWMRFPNFFT